MMPEQDDHAFQITYAFMMSISIEVDDDGNYDLDSIDSSFGDPVGSSADYTVLVISHANPYGKPHVDGDPLDRANPSGYVFSSRRVER